MKRTALAFVVCLLLASVSFAQQNPADAPASKEDIQRYLDAMHTRDLLKTMMQAMTKQMHQMVHDMIKDQKNLPPDFEERMFKNTDSMWEDFPVDEYLDAVAPVYQRHLAKGDVDALVAFYSTPTGQKMVKEMPAMTAESMQAASGIMRKLMAKAMQRVQDEIAQLQKEASPTPTKKAQQN